MIKNFRFLSTFPPFSYLTFFLSFMFNFSSFFIVKRKNIKKSPENINRTKKKKKKKQNS